MQLMIDVLQETPTAIRLAAKFLTDHAALREIMEAPAAPQIPLNFTPSAEVPPVPVVPTGTQPVTPVAPTAPPAPPPSNVVELRPASPPVMLEFDSAGVPWDARIHQKNKSKKKDNTWKLQKGIDANLVTAVMQTLHAYRRPPDASATAGAVAPVSLPQAQSQAGYPAPPPPPPTQGYQAPEAPQAPPAPQAGYPAAPLPAAPQAFQGQAQAPVSLHAVAPVPLPPAVDVGVPNTAHTNVLPPVGPMMDYRTLVTKIAGLRTAGRLTGEQINSLVMQAGAPSLQMLASMAHLIPTVDALVDSVLLGQ